MSDYTFATVIIDGEYKQQAQADMGDGFFNTGLSVNGDVPATHFMSSGPFDNLELEKIANVVSWPNKVYFGQDWSAAIEAEGLKIALEPVVVEGV